EPRVTAVRLAQSEQYSSSVIPTSSAASNSNNALVTAGATPKRSCHRSATSTRRERRSATDSRSVIMPASHDPARARWQPAKPSQILVADVNHSLIPESDNDND